MSAFSYEELIEKGRPLWKPLTKVDSEYVEKIRSESGFELILSNVMEEKRNTTRCGVVIKPPIKNKLKLESGDIIYFHHNEVSTSKIPDGSGGVMEMQGRGSFLPSKKLFLINADNIYLIQRGDKLIEIDPYCFVAPYNTKKVDEDKYKHVIIPEELNKIESEKLGIVRYSCDTLRARNINEGDVVGFTRYSKYEFPINDEKLFRMNADWIIFKKHGKDTTISG